MTSRDTLAAIRFGTGLGPNGAAAADELVTLLRGPDRMAAAYPQDSFEDRAEAAMRYQAIRRARRDSDEALALFRQFDADMRADQTQQLALTLARGVAARDGLRERLTWFWADHFTTTGNRAAMRGSITAYVEEAIRPHVAGRFGDMLEAAILHPVMVLYLDQEQSVGPNSRAGRSQDRDLNENLARELLELHTLGVDGGYTQRDVREMAELLTGIGIAQGRNLTFRPVNAEPGPETVLGTSYGGARPAHLDEVRAALHDLALRPETARHLSTKLADYFLSDAPDPGLIDSMAAVYEQTGGDLAQVMQAMLSHPAAWAMRPGRVKRPLHFIASALRALGVEADEIVRAPRQIIHDRVHLPMIAMGQRWQGAAGPDGYFDDDPEWIRPQTLAARIGWAMMAASEMTRRLADPRAFVGAALGDLAREDLHRAAARAETRAEGVGIVLASPDFLRS